MGLAEFAAILRRRWWVIAGTTTAFLGLGIAFLAVTKPIYASSTQIFIDPRNRAAFVIEGTGSGAGYDPNLVDSQVVIIESDTVLRRVIEAEKLGEDAEFSKGDGEPRANALRNLKEATKVRRPDRTYIVEVEVRTGDAEKSARLANAIARAYLSDGRDSKSETSRREESWLERHLSDLQGRLRQAEQAVEKFKLDNAIVGLAGVTTVEQRLGELNKGMVEAQRRTADARATLEQVEMLRRTGRLPDATSEALRSTSIERLRAQLAETLRLEANSRSTLGPRHPAAMEIREQVGEARRQLNEELGRIAEAARSAFNVAKANEAALERQVDQLKSQTTSTNQTLVRLRDLERAVDAQKAVYTKFLSDKEQIARLSVDTPAGRVIAPAVVPTKKAFPNKVLILALSLVGGLMIGVGLALAIETFAEARRAGRRARSSESEPQDVAWMSEPLPDAQPLPAPARAEAPASLSQRWVGHPITQASIRARAPAQTQKRHAVAPRSAPSGIITVSLPRVEHNRPDLVRIQPASAFAGQVTSLAQSLAHIRRHPRKPVSVLLVGASAGADTKMLAANLAFALQDCGEIALMIEANPHLPALGAQVPHHAARYAMPLQGRKQPVTPLPGASSEGPFLLLLGTEPQWAKTPAVPSRGPSIIVIDGPPAGSAALASIRFERGLDLAIIVQEAGMRPMNVALPPGLVASLRTEKDLAA